MVTIVGNHEYMETDGINSVQSSLKSHPLWATPGTACTDKVF